MLRPVSAPFLPDGGLRLVSGNLGRAMRAMRALKAKGILTEEEFSAKKAELLKRLV